MDKNIDSSYFKNVLSLAYLGDSVFSLMVRDYLVKNHELKPSGLNKIANTVVCAGTQAVLLDEIKDELSADEQDIMLRARNSHNHSKAKHSTVEEYNKATQFEAVIGYLYLKKDYAKLEKIFNKYVVGKL